MSQSLVETVTEWSHIKFDHPVALVRRDELQLGDLVQSSHGYRGVVVEKRVHPSENGTVYLNLEVHAKGSGVFRSEIYDRNTTIPLLARPEAPKSIAVLENYRHTETLVRLANELQAAVASNSQQVAVSRLQQAVAVLEHLVEDLLGVSA